jgi:Tfp pilus assembly protein PilF
LKEAQGAANEHSTTIIRINLANALVITANDLQNSNREGKDDATQRYRQALTQYREALKMEPMHPAINRNLGMLLMHYHANREAAEHFRRVLQVVPNEPTSLELLHKIEAEEKP